MSAFAHAPGVTEAAVRYDVRRSGQADGRQHKPHKAEPLAEAIDYRLHRQAANQADPEMSRPRNLHALHDWLCQEHGYPGSHKSVVRFVRAHYPRPRLRPFSRVETPPGAQAPADWGEFRGINLGHGPETLYGFVLVLSHSWREALVWCRYLDQLARQHAQRQRIKSPFRVRAATEKPQRRDGQEAGFFPLWLLGRRAAI